MAVRNRVHGVKQVIPGSISEVSFDAAVQAKLNRQIEHLVSAARAPLATDVAGALPSGVTELRGDNYDIAVGTVWVHAYDDNGTPKAETYKYVGLADVKWVKISLTLDELGGLASLNMADIDIPVSQVQGLQALLDQKQNASQVQTAINTSLSPYSTTTQMTTAINQAVDGLQDAGQVQAAINTSLSPYSTTAQTNTTIDNKIVAGRLAKAYFEHVVSGNAGSLAFTATTIPASSTEFDKWVFLGGNKVNNVDFGVNFATKEVSISQAVEDGQIVEFVYYYYPN